MKIKSTAILVVLLFIACSKENTNNKLQTSLLSNSINALDTAKIPLNDLGSGTFRDSVGGLYPGGVNIPPGTYAHDLSRAAKNIIPLDTFGHSSLNGKVTFISIGGSTGGHNMKDLITKTSGNPATNPYLKMFTCNNGTTDASLKDIIDTASPYWAHITQVIKGARSSNRQIQVIYLETDDTTTNVKWPDRPVTGKNHIESCMHVFKRKFPNIKIVYVLGRTQTFGTKAIWNKEPCPYYFSWSCKWAIQDQINGVKAMNYTGKNAVAPMLAWGFYQWADSLPRKTDGFYWRASETADGLHANEVGQDTLSARFQNFLLTDKYAKIWYGKNAGITH